MCEKLNEKQVEYIDLQAWGFINRRLQGVGDHLGVLLGARRVRGRRHVPAQPGGSGRRVDRAVEDGWATDVPGDEAAGDRGIPFRQSDVEDEEFEFTFLGDGYPSCPGLPSSRPVAGECDADNFDFTNTFNMNVTESIALVQVGLPTSQCASGSGWVDRSWNPRPEEVVITPCTGVTCTGTMEATTLAPYSGYPIVNILLYSMPRAAAPPFCEGLYRLFVAEPGWVVQPRVPECGQRVHVGGPPVD